MFVPGTDQAYEEGGSENDAEPRPGHSMSSEALCMW